MAPDPTGEAHDPQSATGSTTATASILVAHISISAADVMKPTLLSIAKHQIQTVSQSERNDSGFWPH